MILFGIFLIICVILGFILFLSMGISSDPISWLLVGSSLGIVLAVGIICMAEGRRK
jgi:hypothetical protein